jgi:regulator of protease activity HflC (stomatin/prohibitin superfamily)
LSFVNCWGIFSSAFKQIDAGTVGVTTLYGNVQTGILRSGLNVINPLLMWLTSIFELKTIRCLPRKMKEISLVMMRVLSNDGLEVVIDLTVLYRVSAVDAPRILKK